MEAINQPTPVILDDADLLELEIRPYDDVDGRHMARLTVAERDALCQTVRALRADVKAEHSLRVMQNAMRESAEKECADLRAELKGKQQVIDELITTAKNWEDEAARLQSRLAQVEKERDDLLEAMNVALPEKQP